MRKAGQIVLFRFPQADLEKGKLRPALLLGKLPGVLDDWLICMISSQTRHHVPEFDEIVKETDSDFAASGLKVTSLIRVGRLAAIEADILMGAIGQISPDRLHRIRENLSQWLLGVSDRPHEGRDGPSPERQDPSPSAPSLEESHDS